MRFTKRAKEMIELANQISIESKFNYIHPLHLLAAAFSMNYEKNVELVEITNIKANTILNWIKIQNIEKNIVESILIKIDENEYNLSILTNQVLINAKKKTQQFEEHGQLYLDDGVIIWAVINNESEEITKFLTNIDKDLVISIVASPRDMIVDLNQDFSVKKIDGIIVRKVSIEDKDKVIEFVLKNFYERWTKTILNGFETIGLPIYIALKDDDIIGFAGYNISKNREKYFGPLGVLKKYRNQDVGRLLVVSCMQDMKSLGYKTCTIGNGSTIEFYKNVCNAEYLPYKINL